MYLKRLDLQGFKSFPEKVKLEFNPGVTAVVGPNGSGKSNVSDAVRWVLGEQRAKSLRGDKMEDVIFAGTENRKPLGFAEVSITVDNQDQRLPLDYTEIQVTRRVFRSGESEYRINGTPCRLKDIQELFMDTGVGREGYSIIGQGRIDEILSAKGEERRRIFEEAAGIVKYKTRKNEAANKLEREQQNLIRVNDIISELEQQLAPLERQSEKAREYLALKEELKQAEVIAFSRQLEAAEGTLHRLAEEKTQAEQQAAEYLQRGSQAKAQAAEKESRSSLLEEQIQQYNDTLAELRAEKERREGEIRLAQEQKHNDEANILRMQEELSQWQAQMAENENQLALCASQISALRIGMEQQQEQLRRQEQAHDSLSSALYQEEMQAEGFKDEIFEHVRLGTEARGEISKREAMKEQFAGRMKQLQEEKQHSESRIHQCDIHLQALEKENERVTEETASLEQERDALVRDRQQAQQAQAQAQNSLSAEEKNDARIQSRLSVLMEMERENEGFYHSVKSLLHLPDRQQRGICGAVGQLLKVDEMYEVAIEAALGAAVQNIVTNTEEDAREAIQYLKSKNLGRATFLPISAIKGRSLDGHLAILHEAGVLGVAHALVETEEQYRQIAANLLGRTIIVQTIAQAVALAKKYKHQYKMVTLEGDILNPGGAMTGGSMQKKAGQIFSRSREIRTLLGKREQTRAEVARLRERLLLAQEDLAEIDAALIEKKLEQERLLMTRQSSESEKEKAQKDLAELQQRLQLILLEERQLEEQLERAEQDIQKSKETLAQSERAMEEANVRLAAFQNSLTDDKDKREALVEEMTELKISIANSGQGIRSVEETVLRLKRENAALQKQEATGLEKIKDLEKAGAQRTAQTAQLQREAEMLLEKTAEKQEALNDAVKERADVLQALKQLEEAAESEREAARQMETALLRMEARREKAEEEKIRITTQLWEEYEMTYRMAKEYAAVQPEAAAQRSVKEWRTKLRELGEVNVTAIEQYREVKERYEFLTHQRADIWDAEDKLQEIIASLSVLMEKQFSEQFAVISENFSRVFQEMFGGGRAYLKLVDEAHVLESAIEIVAQPPGKNLQNMQLLSGGERALTAIAILFAILYMKPSPFCILDEIEAALDDANVTRFAQYLKNFSKETQFIVITHRKGTMEYADVMYGVTMQEKGISKLISVDFREEQSVV